MRQGQQNRRGRGRNNNSNNNNNNNRKSQNPLSRSFESNGPDVKIRGTPAHIAEKYLSLARDAQTSGDPVLAENYLQHAEHYSRIIMAYREQFTPQGDSMNGHGQRPPQTEGGEDLGPDENDDMLDEAYQQSQTPQSQPHMQNPQPQPPPRQHSGNEGGRPDNNGGRHDRPFRRDHGGRNRERYNNDRPQRDDRPQQRDDRPAPQERAPEHVAEGGEPRRPRGDRFQQPHEQPDFLRRPVRRARSEGDSPPVPPAPKDDTPRD